MSYCTHKGADVQMIIDKKKGNVFAYLQSKINI